MRKDFIDILCWLGLVVFLLASVMVSTAALSAPAQQCGPLQQMLAQLSSTYRESALFTGAVKDGVSVIITANPQGSTWTALLSDGAGNPCIVALGPGWQPGGVPAVLGEEG